jgi:WD40-like Beta Propeller Repeat
MTRRVAITAAAALTFASACSADANRPGRSAAIPAAPRTSLHGKIAYTVRNGDIWVMSANGRGRRRITRSGSGIDFDPDFSPDGSRLVFRTSRGRYAPDTRGIGLEGIFLVHVRTRRERQIQPHTGGLFPAWSPDGRKIAFSGLPRGGGPLDTIHVMNPDGSGVVDLGPPGECATWSPDSTKLMYCSHPGDGNWAVWVMNADGTNSRQLTHPKLIEPAGAHGDYPGAWSPDGVRIVYSSDINGDRELVLMTDRTNTASPTSAAQTAPRRGSPTAGSCSPTSTAASHYPTGTSSDPTAPAFAHFPSSTAPATPSTGSHSVDPRSMLVPEGVPRQRQALCDFETALPQIQ